MIKVTARPKVCGWLCQLDTLPAVTASHDIGRVVRGARLRLGISYVWQARLPGARNHGSEGYKPLFRSLERGRIVLMLR